MTGGPPGRLRALVQQTLWRACLRRCRPLDTQALAASALVIAPHPDDETLGCGGTLVRKLAHGAAAQVAVLTDGTASHARFLSAAELSRRREQELRAATAVIGLPDSAVHWLGFADGKLSERIPDAATALLPILERLRPQQLFVPWDQLDDHLAAWQAGLEAIRLAGQRPAILGYPVWFWNHWPWFGRNGLGADNPIATTQRSLHAWAVLLRDFRVCVTLDGPALQITCRGRAPSTTIAGGCRCPGC